MKTIAFAIAFAIVGTAAHAQYLTGAGSNPSTHTASGYTRSNGTYVAPYVATNPNGTQRDNYGTSGNYNPNTGTFGTRTPRY
ncbi:hypothetical protein [Bradyrhizobium monzae]|uniref:hypothetical protein n=1 Tax=Bradyrhizobium sp. Oc8 TaxID=2876780 RepID=UPI001F28A3CD|nr:hypothetical protein [Bradyrhizobium sp. Oc8]